LGRRGRIRHARAGESGKRGSGRRKVSVSTAGRQHYTVNSEHRGTAIGTAYGELAEV